VSRTPARGECRGARGQSGAKLSICARISGEALSRNQRSPSAEIATDSCVRARAFSDPTRKPLQLPQPQFHCGKPPPAAEPRTRSCTELAPDYASLFEARSGLDTLGAGYEGTGIPLLVALEGPSGRSPWIALLPDLLCGQDCCAGRKRRSRDVLDRRAAIDREDLRAA